MELTRRSFLIGSLLAMPSLAVLGPDAFSAASQNLKISHQFPGGTISEGDFRDRLCRMFAAEVQKRTKSALTATVYPGSSLMKTNAQLNAVRKGALDMTLFPICLFRRRDSRIQYRPDARGRDLLRAGAVLEERRSRQAALRNAATTRASSSSAGSGRPAALPAASRPSSNRRMPRE